MLQATFPTTIDVTTKRKVNPEFACAALFYIALLVQIIMSFVILASKNSEVVITDRDGMHRCPAGLVSAAGCEPNHRSPWGNTIHLENGWGTCVTEELCSDIATLTGGGGTRRLSVLDLDIAAFEESLRSGEFYRHLSEETGPAPQSRLRQRDAARRRLQGYYDAQPVEGLWDFFETYIYQPIVLLVSAAILSVIWLVFLQKAAKAAIWGTIIFEGVMLAAVIAWYVIDLEVINWPAIVILICGLVGCVLKRNEINNCAVIMKTAMAGLSENKRIFAVCAGVQVVWILYFSLFLASIVGMHFVKEAVLAEDSNGYGGQTVRLEMKGWINNRFVHVLWCVCYFWATSFFLNVNLMLITANITGWYFNQAGYADNWKAALPWCVWQQAGGNAMAASIMGLAEYMIELRGSSFSTIFAIFAPWNWVFLCLGCCLQQCLEAFTQFAVITMTFSGKTFCESAQSGLTLLKDRVGTCVLTNFLGKSVMGVACYMLSLAVGFAGWAWADDLQGWGSFLNSLDVQWVILLVIAFARLISYPFLTLVMVVLLESLFGGLGISSELRAHLNSILCALFLSSLTMFILNAVSHIVVSAMNVIFFCFAVEDQNGEQQERFADVYGSIKASVAPGGVQGGSTIVVGSAVAGSRPVRVVPVAAQEQAVVGKAMERNAGP